MSLPRRHPWLVVACIGELLLLVWWLGVFPALLSPDSVAYTYGITHGNWYLGGSVTYDALEWLSLAVTGSVAPLILLQLSAFAAAVTLVARAVHRLGAPARLTAAAACITCALPMTGAFVAYLSKDMLFVVGQLLCAAGLLERIADQEQTPWWRQRSTLLLAGGAVTMTLCRQNGVEMLVLATVVVLLFARALWRPMVIATAVGTAMWALVTFAVAPAAGAVPADSSLMLGPAYGDIGVLYRHDPQLFTASEKALMAQVAPLSWWRDRSTCYASDPLTGEDFVLNAHPVAGRLERLWVSLLERAPSRVIAARWCRGAIAWSVWPVQSHTILPPLVTPTNLYHERAALSSASVEALVPAAPAPWWHSAVTAIFKGTTARSAQFILWRGATWCYLAYIAIAFAAVRLRRPVLGAAAAFLLANQLVVLVDNPNQLARYMLGCLFLGALLLPLAAIRRIPTNTSGRVGGVVLAEVDLLDGHDRAGEAPDPAGVQ